MNDDTRPADTTSEQLQRRREASYRLEPFGCGHRDPLDCRDDCVDDETVPTAADTPGVQAEFDPGDIAGLWADAKSMFLAKDFPEYASAAWCDLHPDDPRRLAAVLEAAECWRKYGDPVVDWLREASSATPSLASLKTAAELAEARKPKPPHQLRATPGWPPIAIPGQPGRYLYARQEMAA
ncbi:hypothetical protein OG883_34565 [Streptomyces sp. NBC_01142]|uniref:hypothetical protein n=1 Tax=Streptomyces sp. NBC_01142 TaxID=2975865 RepID=UPI0022555449|nr:hypothetical protein [Streptomyces sp. NBC_01142]MCX4824891.1 hypothetical protein [Streptomyces sp. NBC_01142]